MNVANFLNAAAWLFGAITLGLFVWNVWAERVYYGEGAQFMKDAAMFGRTRVFYKWRFLIVTTICWLWILFS